MTVPLNFILDTAMIPALPPLEGRVAHNDLMGRPTIIAPPGDTNLMTDIQRSPSASVGLAAPVPIRRSSSFGGQGCRDVLPSPTQRGSIRRRPSEVAGTSADRMNREKHGDHLSSAWKGASSTELLRVTNGVPGELTWIRRNERSARKNRNARSLESPSGIPKSHARTTSDCKAITLERSQLAPTPPPKDSPRSLTTRSAGESHARQSPSTGLAGMQDGILLGRPADAHLVKRYLEALVRMTPPSRRPNVSLFPHTISYILNPNDLLVPLSVILEGLVFERTLLQPTSSVALLSSSAPPANLPLLHDGTPLQLTAANGNSLDWSALNGYILNLGAIFDDLLPYLQDHSASQAHAVEALTKSVRLYVGKIKKLFGEVARGYVDNYAFMRGWWDEGGLKGCAAEVGRWGDLFDA